MVTVIISRLDPYPSDLTDRQWNFLVEKFPSLLDSSSTRRVLDGILYKFTNIINWKVLPRDFPYPTEVEDFYNSTKDSGFLDELISYFGSHYILSTTLVKTLKSKGLKLDFKPPGYYEVEYSSNNYVR